MLTRVVNLLVALITSLAGCGAILMRHHEDFVPFVPLVVMLVWLGGAIGLFYHKRTAWICSMIGAGALLCVVVMFCLSTALEMIRDGRQMWDQTQYPVFLGMFMFGFLALELSVASWLVVSLLRLRKSESWT